MSATKNAKTLYDVVIDLWSAKKYILVGIFCGLIGATGFIITAVPHSKAQMLISPANPMNGAESSSLLADENLYALRYLVQRVGIGNSSDFIRFENTFDGASVAAKLLEDPKIRAGLAQDSAFEFLAVDQIDTAELLASYIEERVRLDSVGATDLRRMSYLHANKDFAKYFLHAIHQTTDELIRRNLKSEAASRVAYLKSTARETANPEHRRALTTLLLEQERLLMLVSIESPYAAAIIEPPAILAKTAWPSPMLVFSSLMLIGAFLGFVAHDFKAAAQGEGKYLPNRAQWEAWFKPQTQNSNSKPISGKPRKRA